jgi:O-antigen/teichoic acid export membrane protein
MLAVFTNLREVGMYSAAYNLSQQTTGALLSIIFISVFPKISSAHEQGKIDQVKLYSKKLLIWLLSLGGAVLTCFLWYRSQLSATVFGQGISAEAAILLPLISLAILFGVLKSSAFDVPAKLKNDTRYLLAVSLIMASLNVTLNFVLIPLYGAIGAAFATLISFGAGMFISLVRYRDFWENLGLASGFLKFSVALILMNAFIFGLGLIPSVPWIIGMPMALGLYAGILYLFDFKNLENGNQV